MTGENLCSVMEASGVTMNALADAIGISPHTVHAMRAGKAPALSTIVKIADFFAVPLDFLCDRTTKEQADAILMDYGTHFMELRREPYETYLFKAKLKECVYDKDFDAPWPYNLLNDVFGEWKDVLTTAQEKALNSALSKLDERTSNVLYLYYHDGLRLRAIQRRIGAKCVETVRQARNVALRRLRSPVFSTRIILGDEMAEELSLANKKLQELQQKKSEITSLEALIADRETRIAERVHAMAVPLLKRPLESLGLSSRAVTVLRGEGCVTCADVLNLVEAEDLESIRQCGEKTAREIRQAVEKLRVPA